MVLFYGLSAAYALKVLKPDLPARSGVTIDEAAQEEVLRHPGFRAHEHV
ncbi:MAG TPA: hypothetical protein VGC50_04205 [Gammaproteobacteria bacterium]|jgi:hypothetical protein